MTFDLKLEIVDETEELASRCARRATHRLIVWFDKKELGRVVLVCSDQIRAPAPSTGLAARAVKAGGHDLEIEDSVTGQRAKEHLVLPALELTDDARMVLIGAHVEIRVGRSIEIGVPTVMSDPRL